MHKAILVDVIDPQTSTIEAENRLEEIESLVATFGGISIHKIIQKKSLPDYETYIGKGKVNEIKELAEAHGADIIIINNILKARQLYALQEKFDPKAEEIQVWDRVDLILKIFSKHAKSTEAKLQIALAGIKHMGPRIFGMGKDLMQQTGAIGLRSGQGETNIELMKRHLSKQEINIRKKLEHYETINKGHREGRRRKNLKTAALVGYTNAGKSSLLNALTNKGAYVADELFATLSTRVGKLYIHPTAHAQDGTYTPGKELLISDTIGFIRDLPPSLIEAFKSTLAETIEADLLLHVIDITDPDIHRKIRVVETILDQLGLGEKPKIYIFNKLDLVPFSENFEQETFDPNKPVPGMLKAGENTSHLLGWISQEERDHKRKIHRKHAHVRPPRLLKKYAQYSPVCLSAHEKLNLDELIEQMRKHA